MRKQIAGNDGGRDSFLRNPQFLVALTDPDLEDENATSTVVISLSQKVRFKCAPPPQYTAQLVCQQN